MARAAVDRNLIARRGEIVAHRFLRIQRFAMLIEINDFQPGAGLDPAALRIQLAEQQLNQRRFAASVGPENADFFAAQDLAAEIPDDGAIIPGEAEIVGLDHDLAGGFCLLRGNFCAAAALTALRAFRTHFFERAHPALVARAACLDALPDPGFFLRQLLVEQRVVARLGFELGGTRLEVFSIVPGPARQLAAIEIDDARCQPLQEAAVMGNEYQAAVEPEQQVFQPQDRVDIEMVGGLVEQQQVGLGHQRLAQQHAALEAAGKIGEGFIGRQRQPRYRGRNPGFEVPGVVGFDLILQALHAA